MEIEGLSSHRILMRKRREATNTRGQVQGQGVVNRSQNNNNRQENPVVKMVSSQDQKNIINSNKSNEERLVKNGDSVLDFGSPSSSSSFENLEENYQNDDSWSEPSPSFNSWKGSSSSSSVDIDVTASASAARRHHHRDNNQNESGASGITANVRDNRKNNNHRRNDDNNSDDFMETDRKFESILKDPSFEQDNSNNNNSGGGSSSSSNNQSDMGLASTSSASASENHEQNDDHQLVNIIARPQQTGNRQHHHHHPTKATGMSVRCHCNLASCVSTNYMCKSERRLSEDGKELEAGCFVQELESESAFLSSNQQPSQQQHQQQQQQSSQQHGVSVPVWNGRVVTARRGCIEMLSREKQEMCSDETGSPIHCCTQDMCNYPKSFYPSSSSSASSSSSGTLHHVNNNRLTFDPSSSSGLSAGGLGGLRGGGGGAAMTPNLDHQVWLRAAVIAVPICGLMILVALIVVARRLLKSDEDYKDPDGRRIRRKFLPHCPQQQNQHHSQHHHNQDGYYPPPGIMESGGGIVGSNNRTLGFHHVKPVYVETSEYLLPPETNPSPPCCAVCHQRLATNANSQQPQHNQSQPQNPRSHHYNNHNGEGGGGGGSGNSFSFSFRKNNSSSTANNTGNSETEELVNSGGGSSPLQNCHCGGGGGSEIVPTVLVSGLNRANGYSEDCESNAGSCSFTSTTSSVPPYDFFSKIGLGRSATASDNGRPSHV